MITIISMRTEEPSTVLAAWTATVVRALDAHGCDGRALAVEAGIDPEVFAADGARIPLAHTTELWRLAVESTGDPCIGVEVSRHIGSGTFHGLGIGVLASVDLKAALERMAKFASVVLSGPPAVNCVLCPGRFELRIAGSCENEPPPAQESVEAILASMVRGARYLTRSALAPTEVRLCRRVPPSIDSFERFFRCPVRYGCADNVLVFDAAAVEQRLPGGCGEAAVAADRAVVGYLDGIGAPGPVADRVRTVVATLLSSGDATAASVAARLIMSERTLQRRLRAEETRFRDLVAEVRIVLAKSLLTVERVSVPHTAARLGFSDTRAFRRSFKRHTGVTPVEFVRGLRA